MQNLGAKIGQLGGLVKRKLIDFFCVFNKTWVVVVKPINICPDFNFFRIDRSAN
jgi:hypothetical protein